MANTINLNPNDKQAELKFKELNEANEVLSNPGNRKKYDQHTAKNLGKWI
jgi:curved DNA-binding protein